MNAPLSQNFLSPAQFEEFEEQSATKHDYWNGAIVERQGESDAHTVICGNIAGTAMNALKGKPCRARSSEKMVRIEAANAEFYPDALIFCPPAQLYGKGNRALLNPEVIFEVLSESTEKKDRGAKFRNYRACPSITDYVLVSQDRILVEHFRRVEGGWFLRAFNEMDDLLDFPDLEISLPLREIYDELELPSALFDVDEMSQTLGE